MIDRLIEHDGQVTVFTESWTWGKSRVRDADEAGIVIELPDGRRQAIPWTHIKNIEFTT